MRNINFKPEADNGHFVDRYEIDDYTYEGIKGIYKIPELSKHYNGKYKWFVRVGGGWQAFKLKRNAKAYYNFD